MEENKENNLSIEELIKENKELKDKNLKLLADIQNIKRIHNLEIENFNKYNKMLWDRGVQYTKSFITLKLKI